MSGHVSSPESAPLLLGTGGPALRKLPVLAAVARRSLPFLLEATLVPAVLFYLFLVLVGTGAAMVAALCWSFGALARRLLTGKPVSTVLLLALLGLTLRTVVSMSSGSERMYFIQPILTTLVLAAVFLGSLVFGRPLVGRLAGDFFPMTDELHARPAVSRLFTGLTVLWAMVHLATAATTFGLLVTLSLPAYVATKTVACLAITCAGVALTVSLAMRTARLEGLSLARVPVQDVYALAKQED